MMSDLPYIPHEELEKIWGHGFVGINKIDHVDNVGAYMTRYMAEDMTDTRLMGEKSYSTSKNLLRPTEFVGDAAEEIIKMYDLEKIKKRCTIAPTLLNTLVMLPTSNTI